MIYWQDFIIDDFLGPILKVSEKELPIKDLNLQKDSRVMEDARRLKAIIQEAKLDLQPSSAQQDVVSFRVQDELDEAVRSKSLAKIGLGGMEAHRDPDVDSEKGEGSE